jgi:hypothetical protein
MMVNVQHFKSQELMTIRWFLTDICCIYISASFLSNFLKDISLPSSVVMFTKGTTAALFAITMVSSLVVLSGFIVHNAVLMGGER